MTIKVSIRISESHGSELSEYTFLYAHDKVEELPLGNSYQQNEFSATSPSKVPNEPLAQGVEKEETLSSARKEKFSGENITELKLTPFITSSILKIDGFEHAGNVIEEERQGYVRELNTESHACEMLDKYSYIMCSKSKFSGLVDNEEVLNIENCLIIPWDNDQTEHVHEDTMTLLSDGMQDSGDFFIQHDQSEHVHEDNTILIPEDIMQDTGDCFIFHDHTEHVQEVDTILFLDESMQDSGDSFTPHNQIVHVHEDNTMQILDDSAHDSGDSYIPHDETERVQEVDTILFLDDCMHVSGDCFIPQYIHQNDTS